MTLEGRARVVGDDVNTDYIISSSRKRKTIDPSELAAYLLEGVSPAFAASGHRHDSACLREPGERAISLEAFVHFA